jgi:hypothetical protein
MVGGYGGLSFAQTGILYAIGFVAQLKSGTI